jgi:hypothetical protein
MRVKVRIPRQLSNKVRADLSRPHPFAAERVGFLFGRLVSADPDTSLVLMTAYEPLADDRYIDDPLSGARIDSQAIRGAMQGVLDRQEGAFHVHLHERPGAPRLSLMDSEEIPLIVNGLRNAGPDLAHGMVVLSTDEYAAWVWLPGGRHSVRAQAASVVGYPLEVFTESSDEQ